MPKVTFNNKNQAFYPALKKEVEEYFVEKNIPKTGNWKLYLKTAILFVVAITLYFTLLNATFPAWAMISLAALFGATLALIGFDVMHDACHGSYSEKKWVNEVMGLSLNVLGGNAFFWKQKHNIIHHTYTNIDGVDDDIAKSPMIRHCDTQHWAPLHKYQHLYIMPLYMFASIFWIFTQDFAKYFSKKIYTTPIPTMSQKEKVIFWVSKAFYAIVYMAIPIYVVGVWPWLIGFLAMHFMKGFLLSIVFQLAHVVEETEFNFVDASDSKHIDDEWARHQIATTADFAPCNKIISWFVGGLNFQVVHHLFPRISHVHYPAIQKMVAQKCEEFGIDYHCMPTMGYAVMSHLKFIKLMGNKPNNPIAIQKRPLVAEAV